MKKKLVIPFIVVLSLFIYIVSSNINKKVSDYDYGVVYSSNDSNSRIATYDKSGRFIEDKKINFGGINLSSFMTLGVKKDNNIYYASPTYENNVNNYILKINMSTLNTEEVNSKDIEPTIFCVDDKYAFLGVSTLTETYLDKTNIETNKVVDSTKINGQGIFLLEDKDQLYSINIQHPTNKEPFAKLYILNKADFKVHDTINLPNANFISDAKIIGNNMYALLNCDGKDKLSNILLKINLKNNSVEKIELPFNNLYSMHLDNDTLYVVECDNHGNETKNRIAKVDLNNMKNIKVFKSKSNNTTSYIHDNKFISCDGEYIYTYNLNNFKLLNKFKIKQFDNQFFVSFYIK